METGCGSLPDELATLEDRQDLSQYSYDPDDMLDMISPLPASQTASQDSDKADDAFWGTTELILDGDVTAGDISDFALDNSSVAVGQLPYSFSAEVTVEDTNADVAVISHELEHNIAQDYSEDCFLTMEMCGSSDASLSGDAESTVLSSGQQLRHGVTDKELSSLTTRELNCRLQSLLPEIRRKLKQRRRTLKNRGYAQTCRTRRVGVRHQLEATNSKLCREVGELKLHINELNAECDRLREEKARCIVERDQYRHQLSELMKIFLEENK